MRLFTAVPAMILMLCLLPICSNAQQNSLSRRQEACSKVEITDRYGSTPLNLALISGNTDIVNAMKQRGAREDLIEAVLQGDIAAVRAHFTRSAGGHSHSVSSALEAAIRSRQTDILNLLPAKNVDPNAPYLPKRS